MLWACCGKTVDDETVDHARFDAKMVVDPGHLVNDAPEQQGDRWTEGSGSSGDKPVVVTFHLKPIASWIWPCSKDNDFHWKSTCSVGLRCYMTWMVSHGVTSGWRRERGGRGRRGRGGWEGREEKRERGEGSGGVVQEAR